MTGWNFELNASVIDRQAVHNLLLRKRQIHEKSVCHMVRSEKERMSNFLHESCFLPLISRDMLCYIEDETELYKSALTKLASLNAANSYLYILKEPVVHYKGDHWILPGIRCISLPSRKDVRYTPIGRKSVRR